jgi:hypothetical protein
MNMGSHSIFSDGGGVCEYTPGEGFTDAVTDTYSMEQSLSWEANWFSASQEFPHILWNSKVQYRIPKCRPPAPILSQRISVTKAWHVRRLRMEERPPVWRVAANILIKQSRTADKGWSSSLGVGQGAYSSSLWKRIMLRAVHAGLGPGLILCYDIVTDGRRVGCRVILPVCGLLDAECRKYTPCVLVLKLVSQQTILFHWSILCWL